MILKNKQDVQLISWPQTPEQWATNPVIEFAVATAATVTPGDKINAGVYMIRSGKNTGDIREVFYRIDAIADTTPIDAVQVKITATAKRYEV